jgi:hypothetical protein
LITQLNSCCEQRRNAKWFKVIYSFTQDINVNRSVEIHQCSACPQASYLKKSYLPAPNHTFTDFLKHLTQQCHGEYIWQRLPLDRWQEFVLLIQLASIITSLIKFSKVNTNIFNLNWVCSVCWKASHIGKVHLIKFCNSFVHQNSHAVRDSGNIHLRFLLCQFMIFNADMAIWDNISIH